MPLIYQVTAACYALNQVYRMIKLLKFLVLSELEDAKVLMAHAFRRNSERALAVAHLLESINLEERRIKETVGLTLPNITTRYSGALGENFGGWGSGCGTVTATTMSRSVRHDAKRKCETV